MAATGLDLNLGTAVSTWGFGHIAHFGRLVRLEKSERRSITAPSYASLSLVASLCFCQVSLVIYRYPFILLGEKGKFERRVSTQQHNTMTPAWARTRISRFRDQQFLKI